MAFVWATACSCRIWLRLLAPVSCRCQTASDFGAKTGAEARLWEGFLFDKVELGPKLRAPARP